MTGATPSGRSLDTSYVIEASAGTGKTTQLVQRIVDVIAAGADVERIAAVTFTVAAAGEMKLRIGEKLEQAGHAHAVRRLERAFVGTIHAFCANMLRQRPVEAGVDPGFEELAEPERVFANVFHPWLQERLSESSPVLHRTFAAACVAGGEARWKATSPGSAGLRVGTHAVARLPCPVDTSRVPARYRSRRFVGSGRRCPRVARTL